MPFVPSGLVQASSGLVLFDDWDEGGSQNDVAGGWTEVEATAGEQVIAVSGSVGILQHVSDDGLISSIHRQITTAPDDMILQIGPHILAADPASCEASFRAFSDASTFDGTLYRLQLRDDTNKMRVADWSGGSEDGGAEEAIQISRPNGYQIRYAIERSGSDTIIRGYSIGGDPPTAVTLTDMTHGDFTLLVTHTHTGGQYTGEWFQFELKDRLHAYYLLWCGRNVVVNNMPIGWKIQIDSRTAVVESGGVVTIDVDTWELPLTDIKLLDDGDVQVGSTLTPTSLAGRQGDTASHTGGILGGDVYTVI